MLWKPRIEEVIEVFKQAEDPGIMRARDFTLKCSNDLGISKPMGKRFVDKLNRWGSLEFQPLYGPKGAEVYYVLSPDVIGFSIGTV